MCIHFAVTMSATSKNNVVKRREKTANGSSGNNSIIFMENAHKKKANEMQPKIARLSKIGFCSWRKSFVCTQIHCTSFFFRLFASFPFARRMCILLISCWALCLFGFLCLRGKFLRILLPVRNNLNRSRWIVQRTVYILASHGNENLAIRSIAIRAFIHLLTGSHLVYPSSAVHSYNAPISKMVFKWKSEKFYNACMGFPCLFYRMRTVCVLKCDFHWLNTHTVR